MLSYIKGKKKQKRKELRCCHRWKVIKNKENVYICMDIKINFFEGIKIQYNIIIISFNKTIKFFFFFFFF